MKNLFIFDVEATSLYGTGFAVGCIVAQPNGTIIDTFELLSEEGRKQAGEWVKTNVIPSLDDMPRCETDLELRNRFFDFYLKHKETCEFYSDVNFPVETNFLAAVVNDYLEKRQWSMPYPLFDIANSVQVSIDRAEKYENGTVHKLRKHNPVDDCIASLYCFINL